MYFEHNNRGEYVHQKNTKQMTKEKLSEKPNPINPPNGLRSSPKLQRGYRKQRQDQVVKKPDQS